MEQEGKRATEVISAYERALQLDPASSGAWLNLGTVHYNQRHWSEAEECYGKALAARPEYALAHYNLANLFDENGPSQGSHHALPEGSGTRPHPTPTRTTISRCCTRPRTNR